MSKYFLPPGVHFCFRGDAAVFLDEINNKYTLVNAEGYHALRALTSHGQSDFSNEIELDALGTLSRMGLLVRNKHVGREVMPTEVPAPRGELPLSEGTYSPIPISAAHVVRFFAACSVAATQLRWFRIETLNWRRFSEGSGRSFLDDIFVFSTHLHLLNSYPSITFTQSGCLQSGWSLGAPIAGFNKTPGPSIKTLKKPLDIPPSWQSSWELKCTDMLCFSGTPRMARDRVLLFALA